MAGSKYATKNLGMGFDESVSAFIISRKLGQSGANKMMTSKDSIKFYTYELEHFFAQIKQVHPEYTLYNQVTEKDILRFLQYTTERDWSVPTRQKVLRALRAFFNWIERDAECRREGMQSFRQMLPKIGHTEARLYIPSPEVMYSFLRAIKTDTIWGLRNYVTLCVMIDCGPRVGEMCNVNLDCVMWDEARLFINKGKTGERLVPLNRDITIPQLRKWVRERERLAKCDALFIGKQGYRCTPSTFAQEFSRHRKRTGIGISPEGSLTAHTARHYFCTHYLVNGGTLPSLQAITGHTSLTTLQVYMHIARQLTFVKDEHAKASPMKSLADGTRQRRAHRI
jgi:integrase/recombinase XerD